MDKLTLHFASLLHLLHLQCGPKCILFSLSVSEKNPSFNEKNKSSLTRLVKVFKLISLCDLHPQTKNSSGVFFTHVLLSKQPIDYLEKQQGISFVYCVHLRILVFAKNTLRPTVYFEILLTVESSNPRYVDLLVFYLRRRSMKASGEIISKINPFIRALMFKAPINLTKD